MGKTDRRVSSSTTKITRTTVLEFCGDDRISLEYCVYELPLDKDKLQTPNEPKQDTLSHNYEIESLRWRFENLIECEI